MTLNLDKIMEILVRNLEKVASDSIFALDIITYRAYKAMYGEPPGSGTGYKEVYYFLADFGEDTVTLTCDGFLHIISGPWNDSKKSENKTYKITITEDSDLKQLKDELPKNIDKIKYLVNTANIGYRSEENGDTLIIQGPRNISDKINNKEDKQIHLGYC